MLRFARREPSAVLFAAQLAALLAYPAMENREAGRALFSVLGIAFLGLVVLAVRSTPTWTWLGVLLALPASVLLLVQAVSGSDDLLPWSSAFEAIQSWPKPVQKPHPPLWIGGNGERVLDRVLRYGDGWFPNRRDDGLAERIAELRRRGEEEGRGRVPVTFFGAPADPAVVEELRDAGVDRILFMLPSGTPAEIERAADEAAAVAGRFT